MLCVCSCVCNSITIECFSFTRNISSTKLHAGHIQVLINVNEMNQGITNMHIVRA